jgi:hypothetical protein
VKNLSSFILVSLVACSCNLNLSAKESTKTPAKKTVTKKVIDSKKKTPAKKHKTKSENNVGSELEIRKQWYSRADEYEQKIIKALDEIDSAMGAIHESYDKLDPEVAQFRDKMSDSLGALQGVSERLKSYLDQKIGALSVKNVYFGGEEGGGAIGKMISNDVEELKVSVELYGNQVNDLRQKMNKVATKATSLIDVLQKASRKRSNANIASIEAGKKKLAITTASPDDAKKLFDEIVSVEGQVEQIKEELKGEIAKSINAMAESIRKKIKKIGNDESSLRSKAKELESKVEDLGKKEAQLARADEEKVAKGIKEDLAKPMESKEKIKEETKVKIEDKTISFFDAFFAYTKNVGSEISSILSHVWHKTYAFFSGTSKTTSSSVEKEHIVKKAKSRKVKKRTHVSSKKEAPSVSISEKKEGVAKHDQKGSMKKNTKKIEKPQTPKTPVKPKER